MHVGLCQPPTEAERAAIRAQPPPPVRPPLLWTEPLVDAVPVRAESQAETQAATQLATQLEAPSEAEAAATQLATQAEAPEEEAPPVSRQRLR